MARVALAALRSAWPGVGAGIFALALYLRTAAPGLTWAHYGADGGDLLAAALTRGVPHPPGYPTYQLLLVAAVRVFPAEPARVGNILSAVCAALAAALLADLARRMAAAYPPTVRGTAGLAAGLAWAASPGLWSQAVITEVYALNALAAVGLLWLAWRWRAARTAGARGRGWLAAAGLGWGLGLGNHLTLALLWPGLAVGLAAPAFLAGAASLSRRRGAGPPVSLLPQAPHCPGARRLGGEIAVFSAAFLLGVSVYAYLPWAARQGPPINWGDPSTFAGLRWLVSAEIYRGMVFGVPWSALPQRLAAWGAEAGRQFGGGPWGMLIALAGLWRLEQTDRRWWWTTTLGALAFTAYGIGYNAADSIVYLAPAWAMAGLWLGEGVAWLAMRAESWRGRRWGLAVALLLAIGLPVASLGRWWPEMDLSRERAAEQYLAEVQRSAERDAVILVGGDQATFALWYGRYGRNLRPDVTPVNVHLYDYGWYQAALLRYHPQLVAVTRDGRLPPVEQFVVEAARRWPLYRADALASFETGLRERPEGALVRLFAP